MLRLLFEAQTVQNFSLKLLSEVETGGAVDVGVSRVPSTLDIVLRVFGCS